MITVVSAEARVRKNIKILLFEDDNKKKIKLALSGRFMHESSLIGNFRILMPDANISYIKVSGFIKNLGCEI